jgi:hypothetical protein
MSRVSAVSRRGKKILVGMATLSLVLAAGASGQESLDVKVKSTVTIRTLSSNGASGTVSATENECEPKREVVLYVNRGTARKDRWVQVGKDSTNQKGAWEIHVGEPGLDKGPYRARVLEDQRGEFECDDDFAYRNL